MEVVNVRHMHKEGHPVRDDVRYKADKRITWDSKSDFFGGSM